MLSADSSLVQEAREDVAYAASWSEVFARTYAQWVISHSGRSNLSQELDLRKRSYWDSADFDLVDEEFTYYLKLKGLLP